MSYCTTESMRGGLLALAILVALLSAPLALGYAFLSPKAVVTQHADASGAQ